MNAETPLTPAHWHLVEQVQHNCDISDANHAGDYTLCIYLLKMREYYRWIHSLEFNDNFDAERMASWLRSKENTWDQVMDESFRNIQFDDQEYDPFDSAGLNTRLQQDKLFYHAGIGQKAVHHFFVADLVESGTNAGVDIHITGREYARDLTAPPAISTQSEIIVRRESLKRMCWERYQEWNWNRLDNPMGRAMSFYPFDDDIDEALEQMVGVEQETLVRHEMGEMQISQSVGAEWRQMMLKLIGSKAELLARAVRDHLADCLHTLPFLIERDDPASIHFYFANLTHMRKELFPSAMEAYRNWCQHPDPRALTKMARNAASHWEKTVQSILAIDQRKPDNPGPDVIELIEHSRL